MAEVTSILDVLSNKDLARMGHTCATVVADRHPDDAEADEMVSIMQILKERLSQPEDRGVA